MLSWQLGIRSEIRYIRPAQPRGRADPVREDCQAAVDAWQARMVVIQVPVVARHSFGSVTGHHRKKRDEYRNRPCHSYAICAHEISGRQIRLPLP